MTHLLDSNRRPKPTVWQETLSSPTVVVGLCTRNEADTIRRTVGPLVEQSRQPDHVVVVDASDDQTVEVVRDCLDRTDIHLSVHQQSGTGVGDARRELYEHVRTYNPDILCTLDANNEVTSDWLAELLSFWRNDPEYDVLTGPDCGLDVDRECRSPHDPLYFRHANMAIRFGLLEAVGGWDPDFDRGEDWDLAIRLHKAGARSYTSTKWCSNIIESPGERIRIRRVLGNPSSLPFLWKYGLWYAEFHSSQILKDFVSILVWLLAASTLVIAVISPAAVVFPLSALAASLLLNVVGFNLVNNREEVEILQPLVLAVFTTPAVLRSLCEIANGRYKQKG